MSTYTPGDLSKLLNPTAPPPPIVSGKVDPSFFGYLRPEKGRPQSRKAPKGGGKFSKQKLNLKVKQKKELQKAVSQKHEEQVVKDRERKAAEREAKRNGKGKKEESKEEAADEEEEEEDEGMDTDNSDIGDDIDEEAIEDFMKEIENEDGNGELAEDESDDDETEQKDPGTLAAEAKAIRLAKKEKRLAEDAEMDAPLPRKKDIKKERLQNQKNDPRNSRTIFVGNVPAHLKAHKLTHFIETLLGNDSGSKRSIVESVRYRSVAIADPKIPKKIAARKGLLHEERDSLNAYVVFNEEKWVDLAIEKVHGQEIELDEKKWRLRVDKISPTTGTADPSKHDNQFTIFVGNLPWNINDNDLYEHFDNCGEISAVRVIRDRETQVGKGIAFVTFKDAQSVRNSLASNATKFRDRSLRIMRAVENKKLHHTIPADEKKDAKSNKKNSVNPKAVEARKEGYGGAHKVKELNQAGVLKKPRHVPRTGTATTGTSASNKKSSITPASTTTSSTTPAASSSTKKHTKGQKRPFEGDHADPSSEIKKQKVEDFKHKEKKEKRREAKKL